MIRNRYYFVIPLIIMIITYLSLLVLDSAANDYMAAEDHLIEWVSFFALLGACIGFFVTFVRTRSQKDFGLIARLSLIGLGLMFFVAAGEEITWGQRILGFETPQAIKEINEQGEFNIHNLPFLDQRNNLLIDHYDLINIVWFGFVIAIPLIAHSTKKAYDFVTKFIVIAPYIVGILFIMNYILGEIFKDILPKMIEITYRTANVNEHREMIYGVLFFTVAVHIYFSLVDPKPTDSYQPIKSVFARLGNLRNNTV